MTQLHGTFIQTELYKIKADITKATKDFLVDIPLIIGQGEDWKAANISKFVINDVDIAVKPAYNFCTMASSEMGKVSVDFPLRLAFYSGNTVAEDQLASYSDYALDSRVELGSATTGVKAHYGGNIFKTLLFEELPENTEELKKGDVMQKDQIKGWVDDFTLENPRAVMQKGRVVVCVKLSDLKLDKDHLITGEDSNGATRRVIRAILNRRKMFSKGEPAKEDKKAVRKGRQQQQQPPEPEPQPDVPDADKYCDSLVDGKLMLDYPFYVTQVYDVTYQRTTKTATA